MINFAYSLAPKTFLFVVTKRQLPYGKAYLQKKIKESVDLLKEQDQAYRNARKRSKEAKRVGKRANVEPDEAIKEETKEESKQNIEGVKHDHLNRSHRVD